MQQLIQALHCLECAFRTTVTDELFRHQNESGHMDFQLRSAYTFRRERLLAILPPVGLS